MKVFVTGGSGFVGGHVIEALSPQHTVLALARSEKSAAVVRGFGADPVSGSLEEVDAAMLQGVDAVVHVAAYVEESGPYAAFWEANVEGTQRVLDAARAAGVGTFVHISTNGTVLDGRGQRDVDEDAPYPDHQPLAYCSTKAEAERRVLAAATEGFRTVALRPCFVWGPRDNTVLPAVQRMAKSGGFLWVDGGEHLVSTTHVSNLVEAVKRALDGAGGSGRAYFVADDGDLTLREFIGGLARAVELDLPQRSLPGGLVRGIAWSVEGVWSVLGLRSTPPLTSMAAVLMSSDMTVKTARARDELGWAPVVDRARGLRELAASA
ncbi:MAG: NAD-dependent epimerase/dehydratase family protein [Alphaproteobacteria bacterium]|nr:NAD-dependent epimerase/dehydratase family protein [Alphaproteobacteria bacterium]